MRTVKQHALAAAWILNLLVGAIVSGQAIVPSPSPVSATAEAERVIVTGSNIPTAEEVGPNPVDTYSREDIEKLGARTATNLVQRLPAITGTAINENVSNGGDGRTEVNLRGLFPKETLVLVDGKRVAPVGFAMGASVDLNLVPFALVDHIDILKDGASAIYGSDAVAGVFSVFLKHKFRGAEVGLSYGNTDLGASNDAAERDYYLLAGTGNDKTEIVVFAEYYDRDAIFSRDRDFSSTADLSRFGGFDTRSNNFPGRVGGFLLRLDLSAPTPHSAPNVALSPDYVPLFSVPREDRRFNYASFTTAIPPADREYLYGSITRDLYGKSLQAFADFKFARTFFEATAAPVPFAPDPFKRADGSTPVSPTGISVPLSNPFNPFTMPDAFLPDGTPVTTNVRYRALEVGPRTFTNTTKDKLFDTGFRGNLNELGDYFKNWNFEVGFRYNSNEHSLVSSGIVSKEKLREALLDPNPLTAFNPFARSGNAPAVFDRFLVSTTEVGVARLIDEQVSLNGELLELPSGPISFALGMEHRRESVNDQPDPLNTSFGSIGGNDLEATRGSRDVWSAYGELIVPVTNPTWRIPAAYSLEFQAAERIELYSDTDTAERPKFSIRYQPFDSSLTLRATYTEAFHAPNLSDLSPSAAESGADVLDPAKGNEEVFPRSLLGGQPNLRPEVAYGWNYGLVWTPKFIPGLTLSVDYYHIDLRDRTNFLDPQFIVDENFFYGKFPGQVVRDPATGEIILIRDLIQNISRTITEGIDYEAIYTFDTAIFGRGSLGTFTLTVNGNYLSRYVAAINVGDRELEYAGQNTLFGGYFPHHRIYGSLFYDLTGLDAGVTVHYISQGTDSPFNTKVPNRKIREWTTADALVSYTFNLTKPAAESEVAGYSKDGKAFAAKEGGGVGSSSTLSYCGWKGWLNGTTVTAGLDNILDSDPPFSFNNLGSFYENGFDESTFSIKGRYWYLALKKRF